MKNSKGTFAVNQSQLIQNQQYQHKHLSQGSSAYQSNSIVLDSAQNFNLGLPVIEQSHHFHLNVKQMKQSEKQKLFNKNFKFEEHRYIANSNFKEEEKFLDDQFLKSGGRSGRGNLDEDSFEHFGSQLMIVGGGDDFNKMHQNFAGDTFSQISSTYEPNNAAQANIGGGQQQQQQSQNEIKSSNLQSKLHSYHERNAIKSHQQNNDELLDSAILNNLNEDMNSPKDSTPQNQFNHHNQNHIIANNFHINNYKPTTPQLLFNNNNNLHIYPSPHSNLNNIIMNSENLQQSDVQSSTMTLYNSGIFDDASIMRILDKSISDDSLFQVTQTNDESGGAIGKKRRVIEQFEQNFKFECEDVKQIVTGVSAKLKEKLQKQAKQNSISQFVAIQMEELKQLEILSSSAIEKIRLIQHIGVQVLDQQKVKSLTIKNYKQNLKIRLHNHIQRYKDLCKKQNQQTERMKFKYQINEFELNEKIKQLEERIERQTEDINKIANRNEQLKFEKKVMAQKNDQKLNEIEKVLKVVLRAVQAQSKGSNSSKVNNSFCIGTDHSMLLQPPNKNSFLFEKKQAQNLSKHQLNDLQQSIDGGKENESILSNTSQKDIQIKPHEIIGYLSKLKSMVKQNRQLNQLVEQNQHQQQEGGSYYESSSIFNLIGELNNKGFLMNQQEQQLQQRDSLIQQSQFVASEADMNRAFIQSQQESSQSSPAVSQNPRGFLLFQDKQSKALQQDQIDQSLDYKFNEDHILVVMDGVAAQNEEENSFMFLDDRISAKDLAGGQQHKADDRSERSLILHQQQREKILVNQNRKNNNNDPFLNTSNENSINDDLNILQTLTKNGNPNEIFNADLSGINDEAGGGNSKLLFQPSAGRNIFIADEFTGGGLSLAADDFNSRNGGGEKLYSGGSSQFSMIKAFQKSFSSSNKKGDQIIVVKVRERQVTMPKLNLKRIVNQGELYKFNLQEAEGNPTNQNISPSQQSSSSFSEPSSMPIQAQNSIQMVSQPHITSSFQNDSISKNDELQVMSGIGQGASLESANNQILDKAVYIGSEDKNNNSVASNKQDSVVQGGFNMFDSFKKELGMIEKAPPNEKSYDKTNLKVTNKILTLDESLFNENQQNNSKEEQDYIFNQALQQDFFKHQQKPSQHNPKPLNDSLDLSLNVSRFKKSLSDPNLLFQDLDSEEEFQPNKDTQDSKHPQILIQREERKNSQDISQQHPSQVAKFDIKKVKTPQGIQQKIKLNIQLNSQNTNGQDQRAALQKPVVKKTLGQFQAKLRSSSGNSRQVEDKAITIDGANNPYQQLQNQQQQNGLKIKKMPAAGGVRIQGNAQKLAKINKIGSRKLENLSYIENKDEADSSILQVQSMQKSIIADSGIEDDHSKVVGAVIKKKIVNNKSKKIRDPLILDDQMQSSNDDEVQDDARLSSQQNKPQLIQNYMQSAAAMSNGQNQKQTNVKYSSNPKVKVTNLTRNPLAINLKNSFQDQDKEGLNYASQQQISQQKELIIEQNYYSVKETSNANMLQQMKDYQESQDLNANQGVLRQKRQQLINEKEDNYAALSPNKNPQRSSQSHTPQKKNIIVVNKDQIIKNNNKITSKNQHNNQTELSKYESISGAIAVNPSSIKLNPASISMKRISIQRKRQVSNQNVTVINPSMNQSHLHVEEQNDKTVVHHNIDNSMMLNDITIIQKKKPQIIKSIIKKSIHELHPGQQIQAQDNNLPAKIASLASKNIQSLLQNGPMHLKSLNRQFQKLKQPPQGNNIPLNLESDIQIQPINQQQFFSVQSSDKESHNEQQDRESVEIALNQGKQLRIKEPSGEEVISKGGVQKLRRRDFFANKQLQ